MAGIERTIDHGNNYQVWGGGSTPNMIDELEEYTGDLENAVVEHAAKDYRVVRAIVHNGYEKHAQERDRMEQALQAAEVELIKARGKYNRKCEAIKDRFAHRDRKYQNAMAEVKELREYFRTTGNEYIMEQIDKEISANYPLPIEEERHEND